MARHMLRDGKDCTWARPAPHAQALRDLQLRAGHPPRRGQRGAAAHAHNHAATRDAERRRAARSSRPASSAVLIHASGRAAATAVFHGSAVSPLLASVARKAERSRDITCKVRRCRR